MLVLLDEREILRREKLRRVNDRVRYAKGQAVRRLVGLQKAPRARQKLACVVDSCQRDGHSCSFHSCSLATLRETCHIPARSCVYVERRRHTGSSICAWYHVSA